MEFKEKVELIQVRVKFDIEEFMKLYRADVTREGMMVDLGLSMYSVVKILAELKLPTPKGKRKKGYEDFYAKLHDVPEAWEPSEEMREENVYLQHKLGVAERAIQRARDENNHLRGNIRKDTRADSLEERILNLVEGALPIKRNSKIMLNVPKGDKVRYKYHVSTLLLSDLHVEEAIDIRTVGLSNTFNWEVMEGRLNLLFKTWLEGYRGEDQAVVFCSGDFVSGSIHDTLMSTTKPTMQAIQDLTDFLADHIAAASKIFKRIDVPCLSGNHERLQERLVSQYKNFDLGYIMHHLLEAKLRDCKNVHFNISTTGFAVTKISGGKYVGSHHGDQAKGKGEAHDLKLIEGFKNICGEDVSHTVSGHTHMFSYVNHYRGAQITNGNLVGSNSYSTANNFLKLVASQTIITFLPNGDVESVRQVILDG